MYNMVFIASVGVVGLVEWLKNILPAKIVESKFGVPVVSGVISAAVGVGAVALAPVLGFDIERNVVNFIIGAFGTVGLVQVSYNVLLQTFKAVVAKLKERSLSVKAGAESNAPDADEIVGTIEEKVSEAVKKALENR